uniref:J domain-containing protein n=1 Tax=Paramoeba aestuarina TaxID=180227 RepID=A0A7S4KRR3_9EUKA|mmetsp:Transcript_24174/g.37677  ORF Transcript_24174/g.37677 Transcript_24174/m.37677 type:complete len:380 (+) Transcript_24174:339-1478(+)|eukprot:CAMPEP_0201530212 /NCGR_PEP_ID=MMETSP0161_2-20130828/44016_1 /ASSEMBLY_ACC=CAM_ASM_000251 /TAXON_ID=180227 /ORGANISM="Neoparamoeba aestuarina, Strain SoJaBio B1-5/56/2" /LENGTH=379 /DNA_ID=CAMNT_0047932443 /DNA_START=273 /DNA_END=1412 /DNA_ORIENTATION=+
MFLLEAGSAAFQISQVAYHFCQMMEYFHICVSYGPEWHPLQWNRAIGEKYAESWEHVLYLPQERKTRLFWRLTRSHQDFSERTLSPVVIARVWLELSKSEINNAVRQREEGELVRAHNSLMNCLHPFETAKKYTLSIEGGEKFQIEEEVGGVGEQISSLEVTLESGKLRQQGLALLRETMDAEDFDVEKVWLVTDYLKQAILKARASDLESELIATAEIGRVFGCLQLKEVAKVYYRQVIDNAEAMKPRIVHSEYWYQMAMNGLIEIRGAYWEQEEKKRMEQKKPILEKLKPELDALAEAEKKNVYEFLAYLFEKHPPKVEGWEKPAKIDVSTGKIICRKACGWYHPDKNQASKFGPEWEVLCEEILKMVSKKYQIFKE